MQAEFCDYCAGEGVATLSIFEIKVSRGVALVMCKKHRDQGEKDYAEYCRDMQNNKKIFDVMVNAIGSDVKEKLFGAREF